MTLEEALHIKKANLENRAITKKLDRPLMRLNPTHINILAGLTESFCIHMKRAHITRVDLEKIRILHLDEWRRTRKDPKDMNKSWGQMTSLDKILENWKDD